MTHARRPSPAEPGTLVGGRYRLVERLGGGAMGTVWRAADVQLDRDVAVKQVVRPDEADAAELATSRERALREGRIAARLDNVHATAVYDVVTHDDAPWLVMEHLPSRNLAGVIRAEEVLPVEQVAQIGAQVADAMADAHALGIVHRDIKPSNVLVGEGGPGDGVVKIADFGIAQSDDEVSADEPSTVSGTPAYFAPECARGRPATTASDVYSLGSTLYACLEGVPPFGVDPDSWTMLRRVAAGVFAPPTRAGDVEPVLLAMLSPDPADRPTMAEVRDELAAVAAGRRGAVADVLAERTDLAPLSRAAAGLVALGAAGVGAVLADEALSGGGSAAVVDGGAASGSGAATSGGGAAGAHGAAVGSATGAGAGAGAGPTAATAGGTGAATGAAAGPAGATAATAPLTAAASAAAAPAAAATGAAATGAAATGAAAGGSAAAAGAAETGAVAAGTAAKVGVLAALLAHPALVALGVGVAVLVAGAAVAISRTPAAPPVASPPATTAVTTTPTTTATTAGAAVTPAAAEQAVRTLIDRLASDPAGAVASAGPSLRGTGSAATAYVDAVSSLSAGSVTAGQAGSVTAQLRVTLPDGTTRTQPVAFTVTAPAGGSSATATTTAPADLVVDSAQLASLLQAGPPTPTAGTTTTPTTGATATATTPPTATTTTTTTSTTATSTTPTRTTTPTTTG